MPATSKQQQKFFGLALSVKRGDTPRSEVSDDVLKVVDTMSEKEIEKYAGTEHTGLPTKKEEVEDIIRQEVRNWVRPLLGEGRAFINAARKAKEEGKTEFEFNGKTYPVTLKEEVLNEMNDLEYVGDQLVNGVGEGFMSRSEFVNLVGKETKYDKNTLGKIYDAYLKLDGRNRVKLDMTRNMKKFLNKMGLKESVNEAKEVEVAARVGRIANDVFNDSYRKVGKQTSTLTFKFNKSEDYQNFVDDLKGVGVSPKDILESVNENYKSIMSDGGRNLFFAIVDDKTDRVETIDLKKWLKASPKDKSSEDSKKRVVNAILRNQKQFNKKVDYNMWEKKNKPSFEEKMDYFMKNGFINNITKRGIKVYEGVESVNEASGEFVVFIEKDNGRKKLLHTTKSQRAAKMFLTKNADKFLSKSGIRSIGYMNKDNEWAEKTSKFAENIKKSDMKTVTRKEWDRTHKDFKGMIKGQPHMMYLDKKTNVTKYGPVHIKESVSEGKISKTFKFPKSITTSKFDEIDSDLSRMGIKSEPDFNTNTIKVSGDERKIMKIVNKYKGIEESVDEVTRLKMSPSQMKQLHKAYDQLSYDQMKRIMLSVVKRDKFLKSLKKFDKSSLQQLVDMNPNSPFSKAVQAYVDGKIKESVVNEATPSYLQKIKGVMQGGSAGLSFKKLGNDFKKAGFKYEYNTKPFPHYIIHADRNKKVAIINRRHESNLPKSGIDYSTYIATVSESVVSETETLENAYNKITTKHNSSLQELDDTNQNSSLVSEMKYSNQTGIKSSVLRDNEFLNLLSPKEQKWARGNDVKIYKGRFGFIFTDGKREMVFNLNKPLSVVKPLGNASSEIKKVYRQNESVNERIVKIAAGKYDVKKTNFKFLQRVSKRGLEGIVFLGAGGDLNKWVNGINDLWNKDKIGSGLIEDKMMGLYQINTSGGRTDLVMIFKTKSQMEIGKLAMWRLRFGDASWLSDYVVNYKDQQNESVVNEGRYKNKKMTLKQIEKEMDKLDKHMEKIGRGGYEYDRAMDDWDELNSMKKKLKKESVVSEKKVPKKGSADYHQHKIAVDTVKNPNKSLMGGPSAKEAEQILMKKFGYSKSEISKLQK